MEKSLVKTDQMSAKAAPVMARKPAIPARRAVSASRSGEMRAGWPVAISRKRERSGEQIVGGQRQCDEKSKTTKGCHQDTPL